MNETLEKLIALAYQLHYNCEGDTWYGCPKSVDGCADDSQGSECNCGADKHNEEVTALAEELRSTPITPHADAEKLKIALKVLEQERDSAREVAAQWRDSWEKGRKMSQVVSSELPWE